VLTGYPKEVQMIPNVILKAVSRDDVDNVGWWLEDDDVSARWFGHYGCGDPVHRGYDPQHMLESSDWEWQSVFDDPHRLIFSIYSESEEHVGESQVLLDGSGGAELSLLIGRKDLWHHGYGTSTVLALLDRVFNTLQMERAWVAIPEDNEPALGLFEKLGFAREGTRDLCTNDDGSELRACVLATDALSYKSFRPTQEPVKETLGVLSVTGLPGSGSEAIGAEIARLLGCRFVDEQMVDLIAARINCSPKEIEAFEASHHSVWSRMLNALVVPIEWSAAYDAGYHLSRPDLQDKVMEGQLDKDKYLKAIAGVVKAQCADGRVVIHGLGGHVHMPKSADAVNVHVSSSLESRASRIATQLGLTLKQAKDWLKDADKNARAEAKYLQGVDLDSVNRFDITVNADRISAETVAHMVLGALQTKMASRVRTPLTRDTEPLKGHGESTTASSW
jgi:RimJ/RimL family protein N-acetyltransferase/cytidylate kinase